MSKQQRNVRAAIYDVLEQIGEGTPSHVASILRPQGFTFAQVRASMWNASAEGNLIHTERKGRKVIGGREECVYRITPADYVAPRKQPETFTGYPSAFHYGQGRGVKITWGAQA